MTISEIDSDPLPDEKQYWGKFVGGKMKWTDVRMTRDEMLEFDDTYRHNCK